MDLSGNPVTPAFNPGGGAYTGGLKCFSVFGPTKADGTAFTAADCPNGTALALVGAAMGYAKPSGYGYHWIHCENSARKCRMPNNYGRQLTESSEMDSILPHFATC